MSSEVFIFAVGSVVFIMTTAATLLYGYFQFNARYRVADVPGANQDADPAAVAASPVGIAEPSDGGSYGAGTIVPATRPRRNGSVASLAVAERALAEVAR